MVLQFFSGHVNFLCVSDVRICPTIDWGSKGAFVWLKLGQIKLLDRPFLMQAEMSPIPLVCSLLCGIEMAASKEEATYRQRQLMKKPSSWAANLKLGLLMWRWPQVGICTYFQESFTLQSYLKNKEGFQAMENLGLALWVCRSNLIFLLTNDF